MMSSFRVRASAPFSGLTHPFDELIQCDLATLLQSLSDRLGSLLMSCKLEQSTHEVVDSHELMFFGAVFQDYSVMVIRRQR
jgi:hypothetical protein